MSDISTFPTIQNVLYSGDNIIELIAEEAITKGNVVGFAATSKSVIPTTAEEDMIGVAVETQATVGGKIRIALTGCICYVANSDSQTDIDAGAYLKSGVLDGTVTAFTVTHSDVYTMIGIAVDDILQDATGLMLIQPGPV